MIHACAIHVIKDKKQQLEYLTCMIKKNYEPQEIMKSCANNMKIKYQPIIDCFLSKGENLLAEYGEMTEANRKRISFIPAISLDEVRNFLLLTKTIIKIIIISIYNHLNKLPSFIKRSKLFSGFQ